MPIFLVCMYRGAVIDIIEEADIETAYEETVAMNNGELIMEIPLELAPKLLGKLWIMVEEHLPEILAEILGR